MTTKLESRLVAIARLSHYSTTWNKVWGIGFCTSLTENKLATDDWKWIAKALEWQIYLGPLTLTGWLPYCIQPGKTPTYSHNPNTTKK